MSYKLCLLVLPLLITSALGSKDPEQCKDQTLYDKKEIHEGGGPDNPPGLLKNGRRRQGEEKREGKGYNPYVFEDQHFLTVWENEHGTFRILEEFTESSNLLRGIENFRIAVFEAQPQTFVVPNHWDADGVVFVVNGKGTVSIGHQDRRESFSVKEGDIFRIKAGTTKYLINSDDNEKLVLVGLVKPVNTLGEFKAFFGAGGEDPESFYKAFSSEILEAAFNTMSDNLERLFGQQKQGAVIKASEEQIKGISGHSEGGIWPFKGKSKGSSKRSLYEQHPSQSNQYGQQYEVDLDEFEQLRDLNVGVSLANISMGSMTAPQYNSRATKIVTVVNGEGYFEMVFPTQPGAGPGYEKIRSDLKIGTVFVVPAGHPAVVVASNNMSLTLLCFEINAYDNQKYTLAGHGNVMMQLERDAKELAFNVPAREFDVVFNSQREEFFFRGPRQQD